MTGLYLLFWAVVAVRELTDLLRPEHGREAAAWLAVALSGLVLWWVYQTSQWRLAEWLLHWR